MRFIIIAFLIWRIALFVPLSLGYYFIPYRSGQEFTNIWSRTLEYFPVSSFLLYPWSNFDGVHYLSIAGNGYTNEGRFFPLFPLLIGIFAKLFGNVHAFDTVYFFTGFFLVNILFLASLYLLFKLVSLDFNQKIAKFTIIFLLLFPTSFFFVSIYSESLFLCLALLCLYFSRQRNWFLAGISGMFLTTTRLVGITILPVLIYEFLKSEKFSGQLNFKNVKSLFKGVWLLTVPVGILLFTLYSNQKWKDPFYYIHAQGELGNNRSVSSIILFPQTIFRYAKILTTIPYTQYEWWIALLEITTFIFVLILIYISWKKKISTSYLLFALLAFAIPILSGTFTGLPRYVIVLFPIFICMALIKNSLFKWIYFIIAPILIIILLMLFSRGYFVA